MYESKSKPLKSRSEFGQRIAIHVLVAMVLIVIMLAIGTVGHIFFDDMDPGQALVASITLSSGLGLSILPSSTSGQLFAGLYGIFSGYVYLATCTIIMAPVIHRFLHKFHLDEW